MELALSTAPSKAIVLNLFGRWLFFPATTTRQQIIGQFRCPFAQCPKTYDCFEVDEFIAHVRRPHNLSGQSLKSDHQVFVNMKSIDSVQDLICSPRCLSRMELHTLVNVDNVKIAHVEYKAESLTWDTRMFVITPERPMTDRMWKLEQAD